MAYNNFFNEQQYDEIMQLLTKDPYTAKKEFEFYMSKYPMDYVAKARYVSVLMRIGNFRDAIEEFNKLKAEVFENELLSQDTRRAETVKKILIIVEAKILSISKKYSELLNLVTTYPDVFDKDDKILIKLYCKALLGRIRYDMNQDYPYKFKQYMDNDDNRLYEHVNRHYGKDNTEECFCEDFDIKRVVEEVKTLIPSTKCLFPRFLEDVYHFRYDGCGLINNTQTNYFIVKALHGTNKIVTVKPVRNDDEKIGSIDLNYLRFEHDNNRPSQIEKFNKRYNLK